MLFARSIIPALMAFTSLFLTDARVIPKASSTHKKHSHSTITPSPSPSSHLTPEKILSEALPGPNITSVSQSAILAYFESFYNASYMHFFKDTGHLNWNDFWMEAIAWDVTMDIYQKNNSYRPFADYVYQGFMTLHSDMSGVCNTPLNSTITLPAIQNPCNDDVMWWAKASIRAYELTGNTTYLTCSRRLFDHVFQSWDNTSLGGGILWGCDSAARLHQSLRPQGVLSPRQKNVATNAPSTITAVKLSQALNDQTYLSKAIQIYSWLEETLANSTTGIVNDNYDGGSLYSWQFSYNYGTMIGAATALYSATNNASYLAHASRYASTSFIQLSQPNTTVLHYEGTGDGGGFAGIYLRYLNEFSQAAGLNGAQAKSFISANAMSAWNNRRSDNLMGGDWTKNAPSGTLETHMSGSGVVAVLTAGL